MENRTPKTPRNQNDVHNTAGDIDPEASVIQTGHLGEPDDEHEQRGSVRNSVGNVSGSASVIQAGNITGDINL